MDVLTTTRAVVELKADEDIHLPPQGLDYWSRVKWHQAREEFPKFGMVWPDCPVCLGSGERGRPTTHVQRIFTAGR
jgi:hypothetical protein